MSATSGFFASLAAFLTLAVAAGVAEVSPRANSSAASDGDTAIVSRVDSDLRNAGFDQRDEFIAHYTARNEELATRVTRLRSVYSAALASPEENEAMEQLTAVQESFEQKLSEAASASPTTWNAARDSVAATWDKLVSTYSDLSEVR